MSENISHTITFQAEKLEKPINLMDRNGDPRKSAYVSGLLHHTREYWHTLSSQKGRMYTPNIVRMWQAEGLMEKERIPQEQVEQERTKGKSVIFRREGFEARKHMAPEHMVTVMAGVEALADLAMSKHIYSVDYKRDSVLAAGLHDLNKDIEFRATRMTLTEEQHGYGQAGYDLAGNVSQQKLKIAGVPDRVIEWHQVVGHTSCPDIEKLVDTYKDIRNLPKDVLSKFMLHYVDDIVTNPNVIDPTITEDEYGNRLNALDRRCFQNENNPIYKNYNLAWQKDPRNQTGETAFGRQRRVGHLVEDVLAKSLRIEDPLTLPQVISVKIQENIQDVWDGTYPRHWR
jgi:hypothetical protein